MNLILNILSTISLFLIVWSCVKLSARVYILEELYKGLKDLYDAESSLNNELLIYAFHSLREKSITEEKYEDAKNFNDALTLVLTRKKEDNEKKDKANT